jgi:hypothetical protein
MPKSDKIAVTFIEPLAPTAEDLHFLGSGLVPFKSVSRSDLAASYPSADEAEAFSDMQRFHSELGRLKREAEDALKMPQGLLPK